MQKQCTKCNTVKPLDKFFKHPEGRDGHVNKCMKCVTDERRAKTPKSITPKGTYAREAGERLCLRLERKPGVAPACEEDKEDHRKNGGFAKVYAPVSLPRLKCLEITAERKIALESETNGPAT